MDSDKISPLAVATTCVPESIFCAWVWRLRTKDEVRIAVSNIGVGMDHAQAESAPEGIWTPMTTIHDPRIGLMVSRWWPRHFPVEPYRYLTLDEWIKEQLPIVMHL